MTDYELSNKLNIPNINIKKETKELFNKMRNNPFTQKDMQKLCDELCSCFNVKKLIAVYDGKQKVSGRAITKGQFRFSIANRNSDKIYVYKYTAKQNKLASSKGVLNVFLHEFIHFIDKRVLDIKPLHTKGFYIRISNLFNLLCDGKS